MKKSVFLLLVLAMLAMTGCQGEPEKREAERKEIFEEIGMEHDEVVMSVLSKSWKDLNSGDAYEFTKEGRGIASGESFLYSCGFDEENEIILQMTMEETGEKWNYLVSADRTGYGLYLQPLEGTEILHLFPADTELLDLTDERAEVILGEWADKSDHRYVFREDFTIRMSGGEKDREGVYSVVVQEGSPLLTLIFGETTLEFFYEISEDGKTAELRAPGTEIVHRWVKQE